MKKILIIVFTVVITLSISTTTFAIEVFYQNEKVEMDVQPKVVNGSTLVPIRAINTALKGETKWNQSKQQFLLLYHLFCRYLPFPWAKQFDHFLKSIALFLM